MKVSKVVTRHGLIVAQEAAYDEGYSTTSPATGTDGVEPEAPIEVPFEHAYAGGRAPEAGGGTVLRGPASGRFAGVEIPVLARGPGSAYAQAADVEVDSLLQACGHTAAVDTTAGSEEVAYSPHLDLNSLVSIAAGFYGRGQLFKGQAGLGTFGFEVNDEGFLLYSFEFSMKFPDAVTDVTRPSITLATQIHPKATNLTVAIGNLGSVPVRSVSFAQNRGVDGRNDLDGGGHAGFAPGMMEPTLTMVIEAQALAASSPWHTASEIDPYRIFEDAEQLALSLTVGGTQYNQVEFAASQAQLAGDPGDDSDGATATWELEFALSQSTPFAADWYTLTYK